MKVKLLAALKTKFNNLGFGDKAFDGVADYLSKTVTEDAQIETAIGGVEPLLKSFQGDIDKVRNEKTELQKKYDELNKNNPTPPKPADPAPEVPEWAKVLQAKVEAYEKKEAQTTLSKRVMEKLYEGKDDRQKFILDMMVDSNSIAIESEDQIETVVSSYSEKFNVKYQQAVEKNVVIDKPGSGSGPVSDAKSLAGQIDAGTKQIIESKK